MAAEEEEEEEAGRARGVIYSGTATFNGCLASSASGAYRGRGRQARLIQGNLNLSSNVAAESKIKPLKYSYCNFIGLKPPANLQVLIKQ